MLDFPSSPTEGQIYAPPGGPRYQWNSPVWDVVGSPIDAATGTTLNGYVYAAHFGDGIDGLKAAWAWSKRPAYIRASRCLVVGR
jgi:hypothetical protein